MRPLLACLALLLLTGAARPVLDVGPPRLCPPMRAGAACRPADLTTVRLSEPETTLFRTVTVDPRAMPLSRPLMVWVIAMASSEVRWNGTVIGRNGVPAPTRAGERPGRLVATFVVPAALVRPGENLLSVRMSAHHLWLPVRTPVHEIEVAPYETPSLPGLLTYLPALLALGALAGGLIYFAAAALSDRGDRGAKLVAGLAAAAVLQLLLEVSRAFVAYSYPWHLARVAGIALLAAVTAVLAAAYAAHRFAAHRLRLLASLAAAGGAASLLLLPWYDLKAMGAILAGTAAVAAASVSGVRARRPFAWAGACICVLLVALMIWQRTAFLDRAYYLLLAAILVVLVAEQVSALRRARAERDEETRRAAALAERLSRAEREGEPILALKNGSRTHRVAEADILFVRAADDYCDVVLGDGRTLLVTMTLSGLLAALPERFVRVHKSFAVNRAHVASLSPRPGGGRLLNLSDGTAVPVGRSYAAAVSAWAG